ncbi:S41 family peptidase [Sphingobacterium sp. BIGb0165]|uniref:S41 family peptidase n=1 Tax=Sphingobacterium sp. BIGb0165 TaxID=2940615 RepID=UPI0021697776|nr:S41 family peptidase [Sphingobacterium sp. BIGb0165]MCS4224696.1 C-terminal processing protease CtpA/Prc [Sphingobacterium sp. BIGb0165]
MNTASCTRKVYIIFFLVLCCTGVAKNSFSQTFNSSINLDLGFENVFHGVPKNWIVLGNSDYINYIDSSIVHSGKYSAVLESKESTKSGLKAWTFFLPRIAKGKTLTLSGYLRTENVSDGYAGLMIRMDPKVAIEIMKDSGAVGTNDWKRYEISLPLQPSITKNIAVGGLLLGKGKVWIDDLRVSIDGKDLSTFNDSIYPAIQDTQFSGGSNIVVEKLDKDKIENILLLARIWGFLKYHHPDVAEGRYNWDFELFRILPKFLAIKNNDDRDLVILNWLKTIGGDSVSVRPVKHIESGELKRIGLDWLDRYSLSKELINQFLMIYENRYQGKDHFYISLSPGVNNPVFKNENPYSNFPFPDCGYRLLSLIRYWNIVNYFYPYKDLTDKKWDDVLTEYIPYFVNASSEWDYESSVLLLIGEVCDSHANLWGGGDQIDFFKGDNYAPIGLEFIENKLVATTNLYENLKLYSDLKLGDEITHISGKPIDTLISRLKMYYPASNDFVRKQNMAADLLRSRDTTLKITYISDGIIREKEIKLYPQTMLNRDAVYRKKLREPSYKFIAPNIGYINCSSLKNEEISKIKAAFYNADGVIIDLRFPPYVNIFNSLGSYFVEGSKPFVKCRIPNLSNPGTFNFQGPIYLKNDGKHYKGKVIVIVNYNTQSSSEFTTMAIQAGNNTTVLGGITAGADGNISTILLPGNISTAISGIGVYYPNGKETQRVGIHPDVEIYPTIKGIMSGRDELLEESIQIIKNYRKHEN